jgi:hypothetical protein
VMGRDSEPESIVVVPLSHRNPAPRLISLHDLRRCDHLDDYLHRPQGFTASTYRIVQTPNRSTEPPADGANMRPRMCW